MSGAGPTILALVVKGSQPAATSTEGMQISIQQQVGESIKGIWAKEGIDVKWMELDIDNDGATCVEH